MEKKNQRVLPVAEEGKPCEINEMCKEKRVLVKKGFQVGQKWFTTMCQSNKIQGTSVSKEGHAHRFWT